MKLANYINGRGLVVAHVAQKMGVSRQQLDQYDETRLPTLRTTVRIVDAMTELGAPTSVADITAALMQEKKEV